MEEKRSQIAREYTVCVYVSLIGLSLFLFIQCHFRTVSQCQKRYNVNNISEQNLQELMIILLFESGSDVLERGKKIDKGMHVSNVSLLKFVRKWS